MLIFLNIIRNLFLIIPTLVLFGCGVAKQAIKQTNPLVTPVSAQIQNAQTQDLSNISTVEEKKFMIFFKTDFQGLLKTNFVKLTISSMLDSGKAFDIQVGNISNESMSKSSPNVMFNPGYIYLELPEGEYKISSVSMLVGTTLAIEGMDLVFHVKPDVANYLGTLSLNGTKERIKLGGVPVIKPGFEYTMEIRDERKEAIVEFHQKYPELKIPINIDLLSAYKNDQT